MKGLMNSTFQTAGDLMLQSFQVESGSQASVTRERLSLQVTIQHRIVSESF